MVTARTPPRISASDKTLTLLSKANLPSTEEVTTPTPTDVAAGSGGRKHRARGRLRFHRRGGPHCAHLPWPVIPPVPPSRAGIRRAAHQQLSCSTQREQRWGHVSPPRPERD